MGSLVITSGFPRDMPERADGIMPLSSAEFDIVYDITKAPTRGGRLQRAGVGSPLFAMNFVSIAMLYYDALDYQAWLNSLRGGQLLFKAWHPHLRYPTGYKANGFTGLTRVGGGAFDGTCSVTGFAVSLDQITLGTLPAGFTINRGDMVSMAWGSTQLLHRVIAGGAAGGGGGLVLTIEPTLPISFSLSPSVTANFLKPWCFGVVDPASIKCNFGDGLYGTLQFAADQTY